MFPSSRISPPASHSFHPSRLFQSPSLSSLSHRANFHGLSILHMLVYMLPCYSLHRLTLSFLSPALVHKSVLYVCISSAAHKEGLTGVQPCFYVYVWSVAALILQVSVTVTYSQCLAKPKIFTSGLLQKNKTKQTNKNLLD